VGFYVSPAAVCDDRREIIVSQIEFDFCLIGLCLSRFVDVDCLRLLLSRNEADDLSVFLL